MFDCYSFQAQQVIFLARLKAGERGAGAIDIEDLLAAVLAQDQGAFPQAVSGLPAHRDSEAQVEPTPRHAFLPADLAQNLQARVEALCTRSKPVSAASDMPMSSRLQHVFAEAAGLRDELEQKEVEPLHLLAAAVGEGSSLAAQVFRDAGITRESVVDALREKPVSRNKPVMEGGPRVPAAPPAYSKRGRQVVSLAHFNSRARGAAVIEVEDLLVAFLIEDQGGYVKALSELVPGVVGLDMAHVDLRPRQPFVSPAVADDLLARVEALCSRSEPLDWRAFKSMSEGVKRAFDVADLLRGALRQREIEPLHLLAAIVGTEASASARMFLEAGITPERVIEAIRQAT